MYSSTRTLVPESIKDDFLKEVKKQMANVKVGDPQNTETQMGPIVSEKQYNQVQDYIQKGIDEGAELLYGGTGKPDGLDKGYFAKPTIFTNVNNQMTIAQEEIFGPVMSIITYKDLDEAIEIANDTKYGLAGYVFGQNKENLIRVARSIEAVLSKLTKLDVRQTYHSVVINNQVLAVNGATSVLKNF